MFIGPDDGAECLLDEDSAVETLGRVLANITVVAVFGGTFAEVAEQDTAAADRRLAVAAHPFELLGVDFLLSTLLDEAAEDNHVADGEEQ